MLAYFLKTLMADNMYSAITFDKIPQQVQMQLS